MIFREGKNSYLYCQDDPIQIYLLQNGITYLAK